MKFSKITSIGFVLYAILLVAPSVQAQEKGRNMKARTLCFARVANTPDIFVQSGERTHKILLPVENFSREFDCRVMGGSVLFFKQEGTDNEGRPRKVVVAKAKVSSGMRKAVFFFTPAKQGGKHLYDVRVMDDSKRAFPMGNTRLLNLHSGEVGFKLGKDAKVLKPNGIAQMKLPKGKDAYNMAPVICRMKGKNEQWHTISETRMRFTNRKRLFIVSFVNPNTKQPQLRIFKDFPPRQEPGVER